jgi:uncharacterized protein (TIGR02646 family)
MIPVAAQPEPAAFDAEVRQKGLAHLQEKGLHLNQQLPQKTKIEPYWRACLTKLHEAYGGICAYLCIHIERVTGGCSVDHFIAKSGDAGLAYEWSNYRLACSTMNSRKKNYSDVLDPFYLAPDLFRLEFSTGRIYPNPNMDVRAIRIVEQTIERLELDDALCREMRSRRFQEYLEYYFTDEYLKKYSPFIWREANRQGLLRQQQSS